MKEKHLYAGNFNNVIVIQDIIDGEITVITIKDSLPLKHIDIEEYIERSGFDLSKITYTLYDRAYVDVIEHSYKINK